MTTWGTSTWPATSTFGPFDSSFGRVTVEVGPDVLVLRRRGSWVDHLEWVNAVVVLVLLVVLVVTLDAEGPLRWVGYAVAAVLLIWLLLYYLVALVLAVAEVVSLGLAGLTRSGRASLGVRARRFGRVLRGRPDGSHLARADVLAVNQADRLLRARLRLTLPGREEVLSTWVWRRARLVALAEALTQVVG